LILRSEAAETNGFNGIDAPTPSGVPIETNSVIGAAPNLPAHNPNLSQSGIPSAACAQNAGGKRKHSLGFHEGSGKEAFMRYGDAEWKALPIASRPSFYQLAKGDLVEPNIHGNDMGRDPRKIARDVLAQYHPPTPVLKAIGAKCIDCSGGSADEAKKCTVLGCALWPFRMGTNPHRDTSRYSGAGLAKVRKNKAPSPKSVPPATPLGAMTRIVTLRQALTDSGYFGSQLAGDSWANWRAVLLAGPGSDAKRCRLQLESAPSMPLLSSGPYWGGRGCGRRTIVQKTKRSKRKTSRTPVTTADFGKRKYECK
jgi:hypothetical protein